MSNLGPKSLFFDHFKYDPPTIYTPNKQFPHIYSAVRAMQHIVYLYHFSYILFLSKDRKYKFWEAKKWPQNKFPDIPMPDQKYLFLQNEILKKSETLINQACLTNPACSAIYC